MLRKDYIQRQFEEFGKVLGLILGFKLGKDWEAFEKEIAAAAKKFTGLELDNMEKLPMDEFERSVVTANDLDQQQKTILATLLFEKMNYSATLGDEQSYNNLKEKCLSLYEHLRDNFTENEFNLDVHYKLQYLKGLSD